MNIYSIYKATNLKNGKVYIGFDSKWSARIATHRSASKTASTVLYTAIKKYGWDNFSWEVIYQSNDSYHTLSVMENYFIELHRSFVGFSDCNGYNSTLGGDGTLGRIDSEDTKKKKSDSKKGKKRPPLSDEQKLKISQSKKGKGWPSSRTCYTSKELSEINHPMKNPETVMKMLETRKKNKEKKRGI